MKQETQNQKQRQLERLEELEQMLWNNIEDNKKNGIHNITLQKLYSDVAFKILRHKEIYHKDDDKKEDESCILDTLLD